jgi:uncharacterized membrane protein YciS (DUF1049 family)
MCLFVVAVGHTLVSPQADTNPVVGGRPPKSLCRWCQEERSCPHAAEAGADTTPDHTDFVRVPSPEVVMAVLLFLLAIAGGVLVGDLVLENTTAGSVTVLDRSFTGYSQGQLLAAVAALGFVVGVLAVGSVSLRRSRRVRRRELRRAEQDLTAEVSELERENRSLRDELARRAAVSPRPGAAAMPADLAPAPMAPGGERRTQVHSAPADRHPEPVYEEARRASRLRRSDMP